MHGLRVPLHQFPHLIRQGEWDTSPSKFSCYTKPIAGLSLPNNDLNISGKYLSKNVTFFFFGNLVYGLHKPTI